MSYSRTWSSAYAAESIQQMARQFRADTDYLWVKRATSECGQGVKAAKQIGDGRLVAIAQAVGVIDARGVSVRHLPAHLH